MGGVTNVMPIVSKIFCSSSQTILMVRKRPHAVNGGGFVVMNGGQNVVFTVDGCGILGTTGELIVKDGDGASVLYIRKKGGVMQALSIHQRWNGYNSTDYEEPPSKLVFSLKEPRSCLAMKNPVKIAVEPKDKRKDWDFEVNGSFLEKACTIDDRRGNTIAQVGGRELMCSTDLYHVVVQPGYDQAFVVGVIAVLDNIHGESTRC